METVSRKVYYSPTLTEWGDMLALTQTVVTNEAWRDNSSEPTGKSSYNMGY